MVFHHEIEGSHALSLLISRSQWTTGGIYWPGEEGRQEFKQGALGRTDV